MYNKLVHGGREALLEAETITSQLDTPIQSDQPYCHVVIDSESGKVIDPDVEESNGLFIPRLTWVPLH